LKVPIEHLLRELTPVGVAAYFYELPIDGDIGRMAVTMLPQLAIVCALLNVPQTASELRAFRCGSGELFLFLIREVFA
jgi:hypothetical protein